jgi:hypothetical protein
MDGDTGVIEGDDGAIEGASVSMIVVSEGDSASFKAYSSFAFYVLRNSKNYSSVFATVSVELFGSFSTDFASSYIWFLSAGSCTFSSSVS